MDDQVLQAVAEVIRRTFSAQGEAIDRSTVSFDIDGWDSLSHTTLMLAIERRFGVRIAPAEAAALGDAGELADLVRSKLEGRAP